MIITLGTTQGIQRTMVFDRVELDHVNRATHVHDHASTKSGNVARVVHALGGETLALGFVGGDTGRFYCHDLDALGVKYSYVEVPHPTRICITVLDRARKQTTELVEESAPVEPSHVEELFRRFEQHIKGAKVLVLSGTQAPGVPDDLFARCVRVAHQHGVATMVDAKGAVLKLAIAERPTWIKPNKSEVEATVGHTIASDEELIHSVHELRSLGAQNVLITRGPHAAIFCDGTQTRVIAIPKVDAVNPIGSGDAVAAGIAVAWVKGQSALEAVKLGLACGVANALTLYSAHVDPETVKAILPRIELK
jgi:tagatose 6-phosphate kinase